MSRARRQQYMLRTEASEYGDGKLSKEQKEFLRRAAEYGNFVAVCYSQEIALKVIEEYVKLNQQDAMPIENNKVIKTMAEME